MRTDKQIFDAFVDNFITDRTWRTYQEIAAEIGEPISRVRRAISDWDRVSSQAGQRERRSANYGRGTGVFYPVEVFAPSPEYLAEVIAECRRCTRAAVTP